MKPNNFKDSMQKLHLSDEAKNRIKTACQTEETNSQRRFGLPVGARIAVAAAIIAALSISVYAAVDLIGFSMERDGDTAKISAALNNTEGTVTEPNRAWNAKDDEVMVKLGFGYMPEDIVPDLTANGKYGSDDDNTRSITFSGFDLRICDLNTVVKGIDKAEEFTAGSNRAFLITSDSEIAVYNKSIYILFEEEQIIIKGTVGCGIPEDEIKAIASGMSVEETNDISLAIPIANEVGTGNTSNKPEYDYDVKKVYRDDLLKVGDSAHYETEFHYDDITVEKVEMLDSVASLNKNLLSDLGMDLIEKMTDADGNFIPYRRTEVDYEAQKYGETVEMTKKLIVVTYRLDEVMKDGEGEIYPMAFLNTFNLSRLITNEDGSINGDYEMHVIDRTPGTWAGSTEAIYREQIGENTYRYAYIIDDDKVVDELVLESGHADVSYVIPVEDLMK